MRDYTHLPLSFKPADIEYETAVTEITEIYRTLSPSARQKARKDLPKMLRILNMNDYNSIPVNIAVLTLMEVI